MLLDEPIQRTEAELRQDQKSKTRNERRLKLTKDRRETSDRLKAVGLKRANGDLVEDDEYGVINLRRIKSLSDL